MLDYDKTLVLFGRSMFINEIRDYIPFLIEHLHTMGVNSFCNHFETEFVIYIDDFPPKIREHQTVITNISHYHKRNSMSYNFLAEHQKKELYILEKDYLRFSDSSYKLNYFFHTPTMALNWAYIKGFKNVVLAGIDLNFADKRHFDNVNFDPNWLEKDVLKARWHLENICTKYLNIFQLNAGSDLRLPKIKLGDLICQSSI